MRRTTRIVGADKNTSHARPKRLLAPRSWIVWLIPAFGMLLIVALWSAVVYQVEKERRDVLAAALRDMQVYVAGFEQHVRRELRDIDRTLIALKRGFEQGGDQDAKRLFDPGLPLGESSLIAVFDRNGDIVSANRATALGRNAANRDEFIRHRERDTGSLHISPPVADAESGKPVLILSRRLNAADGSFAGIAAAALDPAVFTDFYLESDLGARGVLAMFGFDGTVRVRRSGSVAGSDAAAGQYAELIARARAKPAGWYEGTSPYDRIVRLVAYRALPEYALIAVGAHAVDEALAPVREHRAVYLTVGIAATAAIVPFFAITTLLTVRLQRRTKQLRDQRRFLQALLDNLPLGVSVRKHDPSGRGKYVVWNETNAILFGVAPQEALGKTVGDVVPPATAARVLAWDREMAASPGVQEVVEAVQLDDGAPRLIHRLRTPLFNADDQVEYIATISRDITRERAAEDELRLASKVFEATADGIVICDGDDRVIMVNSAFTLLSGFTFDEMKQLPLTESPFRPLDPDERAVRMERLHREGFVTAEVVRRHKDGHELNLWVTGTIVRGDDGRILNYVRVYTDISTLKAAQRKLEQLAHHDALTGLPNRRTFEDRLEHALRRAERTGSGVGLLFLDLDGFKSVNDVYGHDTGDRLLQQAAAKLSGCLRASDSLCRLGGDEFTIILENAILPDHAVWVAERIIDAFATPIVIADNALRVGTSIGIALYPHDAARSADLVACADAAMYAAKKSGGNRYAFYERAHDAAGRARAGADERSSREALP